MPFTDEIKEFIDNLTYKEMLKRWRFGAMGDPMFQGETGQYWISSMEAKRQQVDHVAISKSIGWGSSNHVIR